MNGVMISDFYTKTQKGGGRGGTSKLLPMLEKQGRAQLWRFGYGDGLFAKMGYKREASTQYGKIPKMPKCNEQNTTEQTKKFSDLILKLGSAADIGMSNYEVDESSD